MSSKAAPRDELSAAEWIWNEKSDPPYHRKRYTDNLIKYHDNLMQGKKNGRVFVPLCGKSLDLIYLSEQGHEVVGVEYSKIAVQDFFDENNIAYNEEKSEKWPFIKYTATDKNITIFRGDVLEFSQEIGGTFDAAWDRGSFVAINVSDRGKYVELMSSLIKSSGRILMEIVRYDDPEYYGPPRIIPEQDLKTYFNDFHVEVFEYELMNPQPSYSRHGNLEIAIALLTH